MKTFRPIATYRDKRLRPGCIVRVRRMAPCNLRHRTGIALACNDAHPLARSRHMMPRWWLVVNFGTSTIMAQTSQESQGDLIVLRQPPPRIVAALALGLYDDLIEGGFSPF